jgi:hypothetical protein
VVDGCSVLPYDRSSLMPSDSARSATAAGIAEPPIPACPMSWWCSSVHLGESSNDVRK